MPTLSLEQKIQRFLVHTTKFEGFGYRLVSPRFANQRDVLSSDGSKRFGGRYNFKGTFGMLYLSCDVLTCTVEVTHATQAVGFDIAKSLPRVIVGIEIKLSRVLDLTNGQVRRVIGVSKAELTGTDWKASQDVNQEALTQSVGKFSKEAGFEAILTPSAVWKGQNLNIITENLLPTSQLLVVNKDELPTIEALL